MSTTTASDVTSVTERLRRRDEARRAALEQQRLEKEKTTVQEHTTSYFTEEFTKRRKSIEGIKWLPCKIKIMQLSYLYYYRSAGRGTWRLTWSFAAALAPYKQWPSGAAEIPDWLHPIPDCTRCPHLTRGIANTYNRLCEHTQYFLSLVRGPYKRGPGTHCLCSNCVGISCRHVQYDDNAYVMSHWCINCRLF